MRSALIVVVVALFALATPSANATTDSNEVVVLLHGLYRSERSMRPLEQPITDAGYRVVNLAYDSRSQTPESLVAGLDLELRACCADASKIHFVTHSLGGK